MELSCQVHILVAYSPGGESPAGLEYEHIFRTREVSNRDSDLANNKTLIFKTISLLLCGFITSLYQHWEGGGGTRWRSWLRHCAAAGKS